MKETEVRNIFASHFNDLRGGGEKLIGYENKCGDSFLRSDLRSILPDGTILEWEFKLEADYSALGQVLVYMSKVKSEYNFNRKVRGVIAALCIPEKIIEAVYKNGLDIELVTIPKWVLIETGAIPKSYHKYSTIKIPIKNS